MFEKVAIDLEKVDQYTSLTNCHIDQSVLYYSSLKWVLLLAEFALKRKRWNLAWDLLYHLFILTHMLQNDLKLSRCLRTAVIKSRLNVAL